MMSKKKEKTSGELICELFKLPRTQTIYQDYSCTCFSTITFFGRLYVGEEHFCFNSNMFGISKRFCIAVNNLVKLELVKGTAITGSYTEPNSSEEKNFYFSNFVNPNNVFKLMYGLWKGEQIEAKILTTNDEEQRNASAVSSAQDKNTVLLDQTKVQVSFFEPNTSDQRVNIASIVFPCTSQQYFDFFLADKAILFGTQQKLEGKAAQNIVISDWKKSEEVGGKQVREIRALIRVEGVPFMSRANMHQVQTLSREENGDLTMGIVTQMFDVPYASTFTCQENITVKALDEKRCTLKIQAWCAFNKSTIMKGKIKDRTFKDLKTDYEIWMKQVLESLEKRNSTKRKESTGSQQAAGAGNTQKNQVVIEYQKLESPQDLGSSKLIMEHRNSHQRRGDSLEILEKKINMLIALVGFLCVINFAILIFK